MAQCTALSVETMAISNSLPVTIITRKTAKAMLAPSYHPSFRPYDIYLKKNTQVKNKEIRVRGINMPT